MRIDRRELLRQFGTAAASVFLPGVVEPVPAPADSSDVIARLDRNENAYGPSENAKEAFRQALSGANRYPNGEVEKLREAIAATHGVSPQNITLGCGSTELLRMAAEACLVPGQNIVMALPTFPSIGSGAKLTGAEVRNVPLTHAYAHDLQAMLARADAKTGILYICNPNNPTGTLTPKAVLETVLPKVPCGTFVVMDEAYHDYVSPSGAYESWVARSAVDPRLDCDSHVFEGLRTGGTPRGVRGFIGGDSEAPCDAEPGRKHQHSGGARGVDFTCGSYACEKDRDAQFERQAGIFQSGQRPHAALSRFRNEFRSNANFCQREGDGGDAACQRSAGAGRISWFREAHSSLAGPAR